MASSGMRSMESNHKPIVILRCKLVIVGEILSSNELSRSCLFLNRILSHIDDQWISITGDACVGKSALTQVFHSGGPTYPKNYLMVRDTPTV